MFPRRAGITEVDGFHLWRQKSVGLVTCNLVSLFLMNKQPECVEQGGGKILSDT